MTDEALKRVKDAGEYLWIVLASASGGDWTKQTPEWQEAAGKARDDYFAAINPQHALGEGKGEGGRMSMLSDDLLERAAAENLDREIRLSQELLRPFRLMKTALTRDGNQWCVLYGENLHNGVAGFGDSPDEASRAFDSAWYEKVHP